ncbi:hypothetical protein [Marinoscillum sp.]|uniref:hypothetical protein n=1 Tax=Marinoscillum sp. TaxID=2024838 RepID=UPI003BAA1766
MKYTLVLFLCSAHLASMAQTFNANAATSGVIRTSEGKYEGIIDINPASNQVLCRSAEKTQIFSAQQIKEVRYTGTEGKETYYKGYELDGEAHLFEVLSDGKITLLFKPGIVKDDYSKSTYPPFFTVGKKKELIPLERKKDLIAAFGGDSRWMEQFIKNNQLDLDQKEGVYRAFSYYNQTFEATNPSP